MAISPELRDEIRQKIKDRTVELLNKGYIPERVVQYLAPDYAQSPNLYVTLRDLRDWVREAARTLAATQKKLLKDKDTNLGLAILWISTVVAGAIQEGKWTAAISGIKDFCRLTGHGDKVDKGANISVNTLVQAGISDVAQQQLKNVSDAELNRMLAIESQNIPAVLSPTEAAEIVEVEVDSDDG